MPKVNKNALWGFKSPIPPLELQQEFADFVAQVDKSRFAGRKEGQSVGSLAAYIGHYGDE